MGVKDPVAAAGVLCTFFGMKRIGTEGSIQREMLQDEAGQVVELNKLPTAQPKKAGEPPSIANRSNHLGFKFDTCALALEKYQEIADTGDEFVVNRTTVLLPKKVKTASKSAYPKDGTILFEARGGICIELHWGDFNQAH